jgi:DNA-nicking Smr family endonuclease
MSEELEDGPVEVPITEVFDLHSFQPREMRAALEAWLEEAHARGFEYVRVIHGKGIGTQRDMVRRVLASSPYVVWFGDAPPDAGGWGATAAQLASGNQP